MTSRGDLYACFKGYFWRVLKKKKTLEQKTNWGKNSLKWFLGVLFFKVPINLAVANPLAPYGIQKCPNPQIGPKFAQTIFWGVPIIRGGQPCNN